MPEPRFIPPRESPAFRRWFEGWCRRRMIGAKFSAMRIDRPGADLLRSLDDAPGPVILAANHVGWWDPLTMLTLHQVFLPGRSMRAPMDADQLERFALFRRLGVFGIEPDNPASLARMGDEMSAFFAAAERPTLWITPQGRFADVRAPIEIRPGVSKLAASTPGVRVVALSVEYPFWTDPKPEILVTARTVPAPEDAARTTAWHRAVTRAMQDGAARLAELAIARNPDPFEVVVSRAGRQGGVFYDVWLRVRGRGGAIAASRNTPGPTRESGERPAAEPTRDA
jgi:1-acyl-sn-glycerol-3-phosphate acyltransferase